SIWATSTKYSCTMTTNSRRMRLAFEKSLQQKTRHLSETTSFPSIQIGDTSDSNRPAESSVDQSGSTRHRLRNDLMALAFGRNGGPLRTDDLAVCDPGRIDDRGRGHRLGCSPLSGLAAQSAAERGPDAAALR